MHAILTPRRYPDIYNMKKWHEFRVVEKYFLQLGVHPVPLSNISFEACYVSRIGRTFESI